MLKRSLTGPLAALTTVMAMGMTGCGQSPAAPVGQAGLQEGMQARVSTGARDRIAQLLIKEYQGLSWYQDAERKQQVLEALVGTGSDLAVDVLIAEYEGLSWYQHKARKTMLLDMLRRLAATPAAPRETVEAQAFSAKAKQGPSRQALVRVAETLEKDLLEAPEEAKGKIRAVLRRIQIVSPNTSR